MVENGLSERRLRSAMAAAAEGAALVLFTAMRDCDCARAARGDEPDEVAALEGSMPSAGSKGTSQATRATQGELTRKPAGACRLQAWRPCPHPGRIAHRRSTHQCGRTATESSLQHRQPIMSVRKCPAARTTCPDSPVSASASDPTRARESIPPPVPVVLALRRLARPTCRDSGRKK